MKLLFIPVFAMLFIWAFSSCNSGDGDASFCDTACNSDSLWFKKDHPDKPFVNISVKNCVPDSITWGHDLMENDSKMELRELLNQDVKLNKNFIRSYINDTSYAWIIFNDCTNGQGFVIKLPYSRANNIFPKNSAFTSFDPKYSIDENLIAWTDRGNLHVEDMTTGKKAIMTFGVTTDMDYKKMHETVDSVNITPTRIYAKVKIENQWKDLEKNIVLE